MRKIDEFDSPGSDLADGGNRPRGANSDADEPSVVKIAPGGTAKFVTTDKRHNAETIKGMLTDGAA